jgi:predicted Holliday junction resolvase-like endonuclease
LITTSRLIGLAGALGIGVVLGVIVSWLMMLHSAKVQARSLFPQRRTIEARRVGHKAISDQRRALKASIGQQLVPRLPAVPFVLADVRFIGHPSQFVVFEGHTEVKASRLAEILGVTFLFVLRGQDRRDITLIDECVGGGRIRWETLYIATAP